MSSSRKWFISSIVSVLFVCILVVLWEQVKVYTPRASDQITNHSDLQNILSGSSEISVPTGVFIESFRFLSASEVNFTGYIWQRYDVMTLQSVTPGFIFPEEVDTGNGGREEAYRYEQINPQTKEPEVVIGWHFETTLRQPFNYDKYPLDHKRAWLRIWHVDFNSKVALVPDFYSYEQKTGELKVEDTYGMDSTIVAGGWDIVNSFFDYEERHYDTNFGIRDLDGGTFPELRFNVVLRRSYLNVILINIVPLIVVASLLFATLLMVTKDEEEKELFGFNTGAVIGTCSALFFVVLLAHIQIREQFAGQGIVYLEYYYLIMYGVIFAIAVNTFLFTSNTSGMQSIFAQNNLIPKLVYWPTLLGLIVVISFFVLR